MAMIDTLMMAYTVETVSVEKVMACICQYSYRDPEVETPYDTEDAVNTWINKVGNGISLQMTDLLLLQGQILRYWSLELYYNINMKKMFMLCTSYCRFTNIVSILGSNYILDPGLIPFQPACSV